MFGFRRRLIEETSRFDPTRPLFRVSSADVIRLGQAAEGFICTGATGSGKSSGAMSVIIDSLLKAGVGMLVLTAKDEYAEWARRCRRWGRERDLFRVAPDGHKLDVLQAALGMRGGSDESSAVILDTLADVGARTGQSGAGESYWVQGNAKNYRRAIALARLGLGSPSLRDVGRVFTTLPVDRKAAVSEEWLNGQFAGRCLVAATAKLRDGRLSPADAEKLRQVAEWVEEWSALAERTRSIFLNFATNVLDHFVFGAAGEMVAAGRSTFSVDDILCGGIAVVAYPSLVYGPPARFAQIALKTLVQQAVLRRPVGPDTVPVAVVADEYQEFVTPSLDCAFQAVARSARGISCYATQTIPVLITALGGGPKAEKEVEALVANLQTRFVGQNTCDHTNEFFSRLCGEYRETMYGGSAQFGDFDLVGYMMGGEAKVTANYSEQYRPQFPAWKFAQLSKGGPAFGHVVESVAMQGGRVWSNGRTWMVARFRQ